MKNWWTFMKSSWHRSFGLLWMIIIALQWLSFTEPIWLQQTSAAVLISLSAVAVIEILLPISILYRLMIEAAAVLYIVYRTIQYYGPYIPYPSAMFGERLSDALSQMTPYLWFALGAWAILLSASFLVTTKNRILLFIGMNIAAFAALDSFTASVLWQEVAWTVFAGLGWLVSNHLKSFQLRYPRGWKYLIDFPLKISVNIAVIFALVILTGVNAPDVRPTLTDPYTAWKEWKGGGTAQGSGTDNPGTGTNGTGSSGTASGYSLNDANLGGGFAFDYTPVMSVISASRIYMRGETRSVYSGRGWSDNLRSRQGGLEPAEAGETLGNDYKSSIKTQELQYTVRMLSNNRYPVLFGAYSITRIDSINGEKEADGLSWRSPDAELLVNGADPGPYPKTYTLTSELPVVPVEELAAKTFTDLYNGKNIPEQYLQLPDNFPERVRNLAGEITAQAQTPYEKTMLLQQYLQQTFSYTNEPDLSRKQSRDFVESFLFEIKEGYCDYYSTALVTMARSLDIPARWVKGYAPGEQAQLPDSLALRQGEAVNNNYTITNADAHSWAEVYFGDYGWIPVEATPGFNAPLLTQSETDPQPEASQAPEADTENEPQAAGQGSEESGLSVEAWAVAAAAIVLAGWAAFLLWQRRFGLRFLLQRIRSGRPLSSAEKILAETERWVALMRRKGFARDNHETLRESVSRWKGERPGAADSLSALLGWFEKAKYSPEVIEDKDWQAVYTESLRLRKRLKLTK
ncbi:transglutaminase-like putative cysteine protease [Paenibacillus forsythiae]|uniref:Transglutaminase-like putative cysteine protease n=1 Tax=Paenibacillus forsythiae TaxID=365616 RepID=A0ABU3H255_9BACL|nr:transglutaminase domain-containing protein [Paenibacillus forsythiae]MDT3424901.1 transglutaminase-like putative cysteine protease [Paenibacillus forsythiae]